MSQHRLFRQFESRHCNVHITRFLAIQWTSDTPIGRYIALINDSDTIGMKLATGLSDYLDCVNRLNFAPRGKL
jgi:hypothetical protein